MLLAVSDGACKQASHRSGRAVVVTAQTQSSVCNAKNGKSDIAKAQHQSTRSDQLLQSGFDSNNLGSMLAMVCPVITTISAKHAADIRLISMPLTKLSYKLQQLVTRRDQPATAYTGTYLSIHTQTVCKKQAEEKEA